MSLLPLDNRGIRNENVVYCVCDRVCLCVCTVTTCGKGWLWLPCQHSEHKGRSKQREKDTSNPGLVLLTPIIQRNYIMCANNVIIHYLEHNSVKNLFSLQNAYFLDCLDNNACTFQGICKGLYWWCCMLPHILGFTAEYAWVGSR